MLSNGSDTSAVVDCTRLDAKLLDIEISDVYVKKKIIKTKKYT